jgi:hypothetical protein
VRLPIFILSIIIVKISYAQTITRNAQPVACSYFSNGNINLSATIGETFYATLGNQTNMLTQGYQQPESIDTGVYINLTAFIEGYYLGNSIMESVFNNPSVLTEKTVSDIIQVALHHNTPPYDLAFENNALINTDGTARVLFPASAIGNSYFVVLKHRNSLETWSANPINLTSLGATYNFSNAANKAFGNNQSNMGNGVFGIYSGDINQDGAIDFNDYPELDIGSINGDLGYFPTDLNGDGAVDFNDYPIIDINNIEGIIAITPIF